MAKHNLSSEGNKKNRTDYVIDLNKIPNGQRKPIETCDFIEKMNDWRFRSSQSQIIIN